MNNSDIRAYPYFFAQRFSIAHGDASQDWARYGEIAEGCTETGRGNLGVDGLMWFNR